MEGDLIPWGKVVNTNIINFMFLYFTFIDITLLVTLWPWGQLSL
jgi:hypothetical protein